ncbi:MAG: ABC transporter substrate-binding protein [Alphaproteobacteria bacterium]|jgi:iron(III) transport system substrate-binding protein|uniref:ABC transporter substrate-binding protein n=1 Tax=Rhizobium/Agrobacterium group TaxID=227290 RepID=UPI0006B8CC7F|nr:MULTISPECIES: ABC transporter substrate-binding protein [Rhizobium/Agrobacterium group]MBU0740608.1 ABC transporter substrate-binding protein [Alphaproteobacteria bacterium]KPF59604.1 iron ABC transporter substrate-binding protein [Rhizobium sp. AAP116]MBU0834270.1 ABC transporter substrate-binding protein [Alphaproteobacteria bacterium]MBU1765529.1 ABC transporter substrate-binding protein [Alphaproteobacteria bacterium]QGG89390.1 extracellular solute-binding protein [Agrobacterium sp. MA0
MRLTILSTLLFAGTSLSAGSALAAGELNLICAADVVICEQMQGDFQKAHDIKVNMVRMSSGEAYAKIRAEARNPKTDLWWAGTGDPHLQAASEGLTEEYKSPMLDQLQDWAKSQAESSGFKTVGVYAGALGWGYNTEIFKQKGYKEPTCWADLLAPELKGEIQVANPNSSGTAYTALASLVQIMGEDKAFEYLKALNANISQYTKSGSAPVKAAARGETGLGIVFMHDAVAQTSEGFPVKSIAPCEGTGYEIGSMSIVKGARNMENAKVWYDWSLKPDVQSRMKDAKSFQLPSNKSAEIPKEAPRFEDIKLIDYDFKTYGDPERRKALLERWDREIGAVAN